tara:strand:+ start:312 stop:491 length:180 start_codon:yes stop_codon:yes gene_type:complete
LISLWLLIEKEIHTVHGAWQKHIPSIRQEYLSDTGKHTETERWGEMEACEKSFVVVFYP